MENWTIEQIRDQAAATKENMKFAVECAYRAVDSSVDLVRFITDVDRAIGDSPLYSPRSLGD